MAEVKPSEVSAILREQLSGMKTVAELLTSPAYGRYLPGGRH